MGFQVYDIQESEIYDEYQLERWLRKTFGLAGQRARGGVDQHSEEEDPALDAEMLELILDGLGDANAKIENVVATSWS